MGSDFKTTYVDRDRDKSGEHKIQEPAKDLSLKEGQKIVVNLRGIGGGGDHQKRRGTTPQTGSGFGGVVAPPPAVSAPDDFFHDFADFQSAAAATSKANVTRP